MKDDYFILKPENEISEIEEKRKKKFNRGIILLFLCLGVLIAFTIAGYFFYHDIFGYPTIEGDNLFTGTCLKKNSDNSISLIAFLKNGKLEGESKIFYDNGVLKTRENYKNGKLDGTKTNYYENGKTKEVSFWIKGEKNGEYKSYFKNGDIKGVLNYRNNVLHGEGRLYYESGKLKIKGSYKNGKGDGIFYSYHKDGTLKKTTTYKDDKEIKD